LLDAWDYFDQFRRRLAEHGAGPVLIGAIAASRYRGHDRFTTDVDFLVRSLDGVAEMFERDGYEVRSMAEPGGEPYVLFIRGYGHKVDAILAETPYQLAALGRAVDGFLTVEDVIVHKLIAWRAKDQDDIESILSTRPTLDEAYIEHWATQWQVIERWSEAKRRWAVC
jgi:hypothetical protein